MRNRYNYLKWNLLLRVLKQKKITIKKVFNVFVCSLAYVLKSKKSAKSPFILSLELWNECNAGCLFCRDAKGVIHDINPEGSKGAIKKGKMPLEMAQEIIDQVKSRVLIAVLYTNGEPLLYKDLHKVIRFATDRGVATMISTNGLKFTQENITQILTAGIDFIKIQLGGFTQDVYSIQIRYGHVEKLKENIRMLARANRKGKYNMLILIDFILYQYNKHQVDDVRKFCDDLGLMMNIRPGNPKCGLEDKEPPLSLEPLPLQISCDWLWKGMQVNFNGDILPCCETVIWSGSKPYEIFEVGKTNVMDVWNGPNSIAMRKMMTTQGRAAHPMCAQCYRRGVEFKW